MKKQLLLLLMTLLPMVASAETVEIDGIYYNLVSKLKAAEVTKKPSGEYTGSITIPESVTYEGTQFSVASIGESAFHGCSGLTSVIIPNSVTIIGNAAFWGCSGLTSVIIPNSVTRIGGSAFSGCKSLNSVIIGNSVTSIGDYSFYECRGLTSVTIPNSVTSIGKYAFCDCSGLTSITIGNGVTSIDEIAFQGCNGLKKVIISDIAAWFNISFMDYSSNPLAYAHHLYLNDEEVKDLVIPNNVTSIGEYAFERWSELTSVIIPNSVTSIGYAAFYNCSGLTSVIIPNSVTSIGNYGFFGCKGLTSVTVSNCVTSIGGGVFQNCTSLTSVTIPNSVTSIDMHAFSDCSSLTSVIIPNSVTSIGGSAFSGCSDLKSVSIGSGVKTIGYYAFALCPELTDVYCYAESVPNTEPDAFKDSYIELATLYVPDVSVNAYKQAEPWKNFKTIVGLNGTIPQTEKCATPTISYGGKKLTFSCSTEGVEYVYEIKDSDIKKGYDSEIQLTATYEISVYATKAGYDNSDVATATLVWGSASFTETTGTTSARPLTIDTPILIQSNGGVLTIQGADEGTQVSVYGINGTEAGKVISKNGYATVNTNLQAGSIAIVKVGQRSVKVVIK